MEGLGKIKIFELFQMYEKYFTGVVQDDLDFCGNSNKCNFQPRKEKIDLSLNKHGFQGGLAFSGRGKGGYRTRPN